MPTEKMIIHIISHTHWDREWFLNSPYTNEWLVDFFDALFDMLEKEPEYRFVLDGQILLIEDLAEELEKRGSNPENYLKRLREYVHRGRIFVGPYYLQPDWQLVSGESLVRNLLLGAQEAEKLGACLPVGWLMDNFGQISQAVQLHKGFGLKGIFVWRGVNLHPDKVRTEFRWKSADGSSLPAVYMLDSYRNAMRLSDTASIFNSRIANEARKIGPFLSTRHLLLMNGYDQEMVPDDILPLIRAYRSDTYTLRQSSPQEYLDAVFRECPPLPEVSGPLYNGRYISVFPGVLSSRMYLKQMNDLCQRMIERYLEPFHTFEWLHGGRYRFGEITSLWKLLLKNQAHDDICGVSIDDVHTDMETRFANVRASAGRYLEESMRNLASLIDTNTPASGGPALIVFNASPHQRGTIVSLTRPASGRPLAEINGRRQLLSCQRGPNDILHVLVPSVPGFGYTTLRHAAAEEEDDTSSAPEDITDIVKTDEASHSMENCFLRLTVQPDGSFSVTHKSTGITRNNLGVFEDSADAGDTYNFSPLPGDKPLLNTSGEGSLTCIRFLETGPLLAVAEMRIDLQIPRGLNRDRSARSTPTRTIPVATYITIETNSPVVRFRTVLKNTVRDHRLRLLFPTGVQTGVSCAETQFDLTERPVRPGPFPGRVSKELQRVIIGAREKGPITTFPQLSFVDLHDSKSGVALFNRGLTEYEITGEENTISLTLFRSIGWLARTDLQSRHGDAGPLIRTPEAQCLREMEFRYALYFHDGGVPEGAVLKYSELYNVPPAVIETGRHSGPLPGTGSFFTLTGSENALRLSALKRSEDGSAVILRCTNLSESEVEGTVQSALPIEEAWSVDLGENQAVPLEIFESGTCTFTAGPKEIRTLKFRLLRKNLIPETGPQDFAVGSGQSPDNIRLLTLADPDYWQPAPDFSAVESPPLVTDRDISDERGRLQDLESQLEEIKKKAAGEEAPIHVKAAVATLERSVLEAQLSLHLLRKKLREQDSSVEEEEPDSEGLKKIGLHLNKARIKKRTCDYLADETV
ncbi:glycoside hydrolase family 38 C-terminal domain-containing protein [Marispirochaeta sp.]|uniref:alpha-mannosidase n=1 Tax=Marispirochaeta sp. TaxID=2038653 RepID=UPI0029C83578|nr:glycoside hydrolase family 38 C-terminal domain-containing protein [Marispirochaeta sp.]